MLSAVSLCDYQELLVKCAEDHVFAEKFREGVELLVKCVQEGIMKMPRTQAEAVNQDRL